MRAPARLYAAHPPPKPLLIWDGDCHFCRHWIERWSALTAGRIDYATSQTIGAAFPEIPRAQFERSVVFIDRSGAVFEGAEAVYCSLQSLRSKRWLIWGYERLPGFAAISEVGYRLVARHRRAASAVTRLLWGNDVRLPSYFWARRWFLRALALVYLIAFLSLWIQVDGLIGKDGILPVHGFLSVAHEQLGTKAFSVFPTLCWLSSSNGFLDFLCGGGAVLALLLLFGVAPALSLSGLFVFYLSLVTAGQTFLGFQWDSLLLEAGFLAIFLAPWRLRPNRLTSPPPSAMAFFLLKFLLFKLMFMSGVVKLTSHDPCWWSLRALDYHYWSQPLPTVFSWGADQCPEWFKEFSVGFCLFGEIVVPFFLWAPRRLRLWAAGLLILLQIAIALTGNYGFFNLLTIALCLLLIDDATVGTPPCAVREPRLFLEKSAMTAALVVMVLTLPVNAWLLVSTCRFEVATPRPIAWMEQRLGPFCLVNGYGLFRVMTKDRLEIVVEGSTDRVTWEPYEFKWKPGAVQRVPGWCAPHQPRLDWQMWFAALGSAEQNPWFINLVECLLENKRDVVRLLARNPFPEKPPRYVRAELYRYRFTGQTERRETGAWWTREKIGEYLPIVSLRFGD